MKALSLWRPWPWAFFHAGKRLENRSWAPHRGVIGSWVAMHGAQKVDREAFLRMNIGMFGPQAQNVPLDVNHPTGIVGAMHVVGAFNVVTLERVGAGDLIEAAVLARSPWAFGPWCWVVDGLLELERPVACPGKQGLWTVPQPLVEQMVEQLPMIRDAA